MLSEYLILSAIIFSIGIFGIFLNKHNLIVILMSIELIQLAISTNFVAFSSFNCDIEGQIFVFFILTVAASESAIGLSIILLLFRKINAINIDNLNILKR